MHLDPDGRIAGFEDPKAKVGAAIGPGFIGVGGRFDLNDVLIRATGKQPYRYERHRLAEATRDQRICQMVEAEAQDKRQALFGLKEQLHRIWGMHDTSLPQKQALIFELWDECVEEQHEDSVGVMARATIEAFVRQNMPLESARAISAELLTTLNHGRRSRRAFSPYEGQNHDAGP